MQDDKTLIIQLQNKDERALSLLYDKYSGALYTVILKMIKDEALAQDLLQETFITIWNKSNQFNPEKGKFYTWSYRIAKNKVLNFMRKKNMLIQTDDFSVYENEEDTILESERFFKLEGAITKLQLHHKKAIDLVYFQGLTHREAHDVMNVPLGTFKSYIRQALKELKDIYVAVRMLVLVIIDVMR